MPEGHTLHRIARDHTKWFVGQKLSVCSPQGRFEEGAKKLHGKKLTGAEAIGKHLLYQFGKQSLHIHLGLYGKFRLHKLPAPEPRGAVRVRMIGDERGFDLNGPNRCELIGPKDLRALIARLGPDPLRADAEPERAWERIRKSRAAIGTLLLNQSVIAGLGNIYRAEILFRLQIHPERKGSDVSRDEFDGLWDLSVKLLQVGVKYNRIITVAREEVSKPLSRLNSSERTLIYKKLACTSCGGDVQTWELGSRKIFACEHCQT